MAYTFYAYLVLIDVKSSISLEALADRLVRAYQKDKRTIGVNQHAKQISFCIDQYQFQINLNDSCTVQKESEELALDYLSHKAKRNKISRCSKRLEISGDPDEAMSYFNDSLRLLNEVSRFKGTFIFDPQAGTFLDEM